MRWQTQRPTPCRPQGTIWNYYHFYKHKSYEDISRMSFQPCVLHSFALENPRVIKQFFRWDLIYWSRNTFHLFSYHRKKQDRFTDMLFSKHWVYYSLYCSLPLWVNSEQETQKRTAALKLRGYFSKRDLFIFYYTNINYMTLMMILWTLFITVH